MTRIATAFALAALAACASSTEPVTSTLTSLDARRAAGAFVAMGAGNSRESLTLIDENTSACPKGGTLRITAQNTGTNGVSRASVVLANCAAADSAGQVWTFSTVPQLDMTATVTVTDSSVVSATTTSGTMRVESNTVRGTCTTNARTELLLSFKTSETLRIRQSGTVCGQVIDTTYTIDRPM